MKKQTPKKQAPVLTKQPFGDINIVYILLLLAYVVIPVVTPNFYTLDSAGPKFLAISLLNLIAFGVFFTDNYFKQRDELRYGFFTKPVGIAYTLFILISLASAYNVLNFSEAVLNLTKAITVFLSAYALYVIFSSNRKYLNVLAIAVTLVLLVDSVTVFYNMLRYIAGDLVSIYEIKSVYSNKNVLASALFVKIPAAMYLMFFTKSWQKFLGYFTGIMAVLATFIMSTRSFYLGLALLMMALMGYAILRFVAAGKKDSLLLIVRWIVIFIVAIIAFTAIQKVFYPRNGDGTYNVDIIGRLKSIQANEASASQRLDSWKRTLVMIKEKPLTGVGTGNWKIDVLKLENPVKTNYVYQFKNHNDFLEVTAETGIFGGLAFLAIFVFIVFRFFRLCLKSGPDETDIKYFFLPAFGIMAYSVDAFFNFPADRPEITALFAIYVGLAVAIYASKVNGSDEASRSNTVYRKIKQWHLGKVLALVTMLFLISISYLLILNAQSLHYQRFVKEDLARQTFQYKYAEINAGYPFFPDLTVNGEPVAVNKARYLINELRYREAINTLIPDKASPWDTRKEYFLGMAYDKLNNVDSALLWIRKVNEIKPLNASAARMYSSLLWQKGQQEEAKKVLALLLTRIKDNRDAWLQAANYRLQEKKYKESLAILDSALRYLPGDTAILNPYRKIELVVKRGPYDDLYTKAITAYNQKRYAEGARLMSSFISKEPTLDEAYQIRAYCSYYIGNYQQSISDIDHYCAKRGIDYFLISLRGINYRALGNLDQACKDFKASADNGNPDGISNYGKYCGGR